MLYNYMKLDLCETYFLILNSAYCMLGKNYCGCCEYWSKKYDVAKKISQGEAVIDQW